MLFKVRETSSASVVICIRQSHRLPGWEADENYNIARGAMKQMKVFENSLIDAGIMIIIDGNKCAICNREKCASGRSTKGWRSLGAK